MVQSIATCYPLQLIDIVQKLDMNAPDKLYWLFD